MIAARDAAYRDTHPPKPLTPEKTAARDEEMKKQWAHMKETGRGVLPVAGTDSDVVGGAAYANTGALGAGGF